VSSTRDRQRKLARAKVERQMARRAAKARQRRQLAAGVSAAVVLLLVVLGTTWALGGFDSKPKKKTNAAAATCTWTPADTAANKDLKDVGTPPTSGEQRSGAKTMTITTNQGVITAQLDATKAPCTVASMSYLAGRQFFNNTNCHRLTTQGIFVLQCGDPSGTGKGGPGYTFNTEYTPAAPAPSPSASAAPTATYPAGTLAMANTGQPNSTGSQFFIVYKDSPLPPSYTAFGTVTQGLDAVRKVAAAGAVDAKGKPTGDGSPRTKVVIQSVAVGGTAQAPASPAVSPSAGAKS
jgi:peptidyl-prolyl cis-trans isomerase B (cyclophilin B)